MVTLKLLHEKASIPVYEFELFNRINVILGNSGTGKTYLANGIDLAIQNRDPWSLECNKEVYVVNRITDLDNLFNKNECLVVIDEDVTEDLRHTNKLKQIAESKNYYLILDRQSILKFDINVNALYQLTEKKDIKEPIKIYKLETYFDMRMDFDNNSYSKIKNFVTEDTESGALFWRELLNNLNFVDISTKQGNGAVVDKIKYTLNNFDGNILVALDYDQGANAMWRIMHDEDIDKSKIRFIPLESFEEVICNSEFILSKFPELRDKVINYKNYIDASYKHSGKYFSQLLFTFVKVKSPLKDLGSKNCMKFYDKGMKNFKECFIDNCCAYNCESNCKLYCNTEKKKLLLCNKFENLNKFSLGE